MFLKIDKDLPIHLLSCCHGIASVAMWFLYGNAFVIQPFTFTTSRQQFCSHMLNRVAFYDAICDKKKLNWILLRFGRLGHVR